MHCGLALSTAASFWVGIGIEVAVEIGKRESPALLATPILIPTPTNQSLRLCRRVFAIFLWAVSRSFWYKLAPHCDDHHTFLESEWKTNSWS